MSISRFVLHRPNAAPPAVSVTPQSPQNPNRGPSGSRCPPSIATPALGGPLTNDQINHIIGRLRGTTLNGGGGLSPNRGAARQLRPIPPAVGPARDHPTPTGHLIPTALEVDTCTMEEGRMDTAGCIRPHRPLGTSSAGAKDIAPTMVDTVGTLRRATEAVWGWVIPHMEALGWGWAGPSSVLGGQLRRQTPTLLLPLPRTEVDRAADAVVMMTCPSVVVLVVVPTEDLACYNGMDRFGGAVRGLGMGVSNGGAASGGALGAGGFDFDDVSPQFPAGSDTLRGDSPYSLPSVGSGNGAIGSGAGWKTRLSPFGCGRLLGR